MSCNKGIYRVNLQDIDKYDKKEIIKIPCITMVFLME